jgi:DMSO/TMAO reductase YedYZ molybdopterin-dependent catalytic subunit
MAILISQGKPMAPSRGLHSSTQQPARLPASRRQWLRWAATTGVAGILPGGCSRPSPDHPAPDETVARFPGKVVLRVINDRPPCLETPWRYFREDLTPNDAFYVRWHLQAIPTMIDARTWRLKLGGHVAQPLELSLEELKRIEPVSVVAVNQCSGNSRSFFQPRVPGSQWGNGAMGNARWTGVRLAELLRCAGLKPKTVQVLFNGLDEGPLPSVPDFVKALDADHAMSPDVLVAYEMNGAPLPMLNGFPVRLVVPGWYATYWVKALSEITALPQEFDGYWMAKAYRIPGNPEAAESPDAPAKQTVPIGKLNLRSFFVLPEADARVPVGRACLLEGIAFDCGSGVKRAQFSIDGGARWEDARLDPDLGRYSFRRWRGAWTPQTPGVHRLMVRAESNAGEQMPASPRWNRSGYMRNVIDEIRVRVV